jgi:basic amino acid/polyamine antiporter, APA family
VLRRDLGFLDMVAIAVSMMLGIGIFFGPSVTAREFPDTGIVLALWAAGGVVALAGAWVFGRLAALYPLSGGPYVYLREAFGPLPAYLFAWTTMVVIGPAGIAVLATLFASNLAAVAPLNGLGLQLLALWSVAAFAFVNVLGVKAGGRVQTAMTAVKLGLIAVLVALLFAAPPGAPAAGFQGQGRLSVAFVGVLFAYGGWEMSALASEEVRDARRTVPRGLLVGAAVVTLAYVAATASYLVALGPAGVAAATALAPEAAARALPAGAALVAVAVAVSAAGTINALTLQCPRAMFALARDGLLPAALARLAPRWGTPALAIAVQAGLAAAYMLTGTFIAIATYDVVAVAVFVLLTCLALPALRSRALARPSRALLAAALAVGAVYAGFLALSLVENTVTALIGLALVATGVVPYAVMRRRFVPAQALALDRRSPSGYNEGDT